MNKMDPYNNITSLEMDIESLIKIPKSDTNNINILIFNIVVKYLKYYLNIQVGNNINDIRTLVEDVLDKKGALSENVLKIENGCPDELIAIEYLCDCLQTLPIFKEIVFDNGYDKISGSFNVLDLGSGTGILSLAAYISGKRMGIKKGEIVMIDQSKKSISRSTEILNLITDGYEFKGITDELLDKSIYTELNIDEVSYIICELISERIPSCTIDDEGFITLEDDNGFNLHDIAKLDPYIQVLSILFTQYSDLYEKISSSKVGMFPNLPRGRYIPNLNHSTLRLITGNDIHTKLHDIGEEYLMYENISPSRIRWPNLDEVKQKMMKEIPNFKESDFEEFKFEMFLKREIKKYQNG